MNHLTGRGADAGQKGSTPGLGAAVTADLTRLRRMRSCPRRAGALPILCGRETLRRC